MNEFQKNIPENLCLHCGKCNGHLPENAFENVPENCGLYGWMFLQQEIHKQKIRKIDEEIILYNIKIKNAKSNTKKRKFEHELYKKLSQLKELKAFGPINF